MNGRRNASALATALPATALLALVVVVGAVAGDDRGAPDLPDGRPAPPAPVGSLTDETRGAELGAREVAIAQTVAAGALTMAAIYFGFLGVLIVETPAITGTGASQQERRRLFSLTIYFMGADVALSVIAAVAALLALARDDADTYRFALAVGLLACCLLVAAAAFLVAEVAFDRWRSRRG